MMHGPDYVCLALALVQGAIAVCVLLWPEKRRS